MALDVAKMRARIGQAPATGKDEPWYGQRPVPGGKPGQTEGIGGMLLRNLRDAAGETVGAAPGLAASSLVPPVGGLPLQMLRAGTIGFGGSALAQDARKALGVAEPNPGVAGPLMEAGRQAVALPVGTAAAKAVGSLARPMMTTALKVAPGFNKIVRDFGDVVGEALRNRIPVSGTPGVGRVRTDAVMSEVSAELRPLLRAAASKGAKIPTSEVMASVEEAITNLKFLKSKGAANVDDDLSALVSMRNNFTRARTKLVDQHGNPLSIPRHKGGVMDPLQAQRFKRSLQRLSQRAYDKANRGVNTEVMESADQFNQKAAEGARRGIERVVPEAGKLNARIKRNIGLQRALAGAEPTASAIPTFGMNPTTWLPGLNLVGRPTTMSNMALFADSPMTQNVIGNLPRAGLAAFGQAQEPAFPSRYAQEESLRANLATAQQNGDEASAELIRRQLAALGADSGGSR